MLPEKRLRHIFGAIGQQRDSEKVFLLREIDRVFEKLVAVTLTLILRVHHQVLQEHDEPAFGRADGEEQIDHPDDCAIAAEHKDPATAGLFENEPQSAKLFVLIGTEVPLVSEQFAEQFRQFVQVGFSRRLNHDIFFLRHSLRVVIPKMRCVGNLVNYTPFSVGDNASSFEVGRVSNCSRPASLTMLAVPLV